MNRQFETGGFESGFETGRELVLQMSGGKEFQSWGAE